MHVYRFAGWDCARHELQPLLHLAALAVLIVVAILGFVRLGRLNINPIAKRRNAIILKLVA